MTENANADGRHDFDFFHGRWKSRNRKLADVLDRKCTTWVEFESSLNCEPVLGGLGNVEPFVAPAMPPSGEPLDAMTLRLFDPRTGNWRIWWISTRQPGLIDDNPMEGRWSGAHGEFFGAEVINGDDVRVKWDWDDLGADGARWEQRFSWDGGATWELNWSTIHTRAR
ncbi:hypothetical protein [Sphaerisporangium corydalis]|uniref:DUF1579 domain-containing protein n=1 Tax=Sphaerisporangium corydalis TaxID=1441875 RepID=A0ABV9EBT7_9ACTN|nr:hypothetical protein [Sphaerisporangium corydalis]